MQFVHIRYIISTGSTKTIEDDRIEMTIKKNLDMVVYEKIKDSLIKGEYLPGQKIYIDEVAEKYGVSRTPAIQAIKLLANERIFKILSTGRVVVPDYNNKEIADICETRVMLERNAIIKLCKVRNLDIVNQLSVIAQRCDRYHQENEYVKCCREDLAFHKELVAAGGNKVIDDVYNMVQGRFLVASYLNIKEGAREGDVATNEHVGLVNYLREGIEEKALQLIEYHIFSIQKRLLDIWDRREVEDLK